MRRYDIVPGILLILSIINFAPAAPVLVQEPHQARVDVMHIPRNVTTVLERRVGEEEIQKLVNFFKTLELGKPVDSSGVHASSPTDPKEPLSPTSTVYEDALSDHDWLHDANGWDEPIHAPTSIDGDYGPYHPLAGGPAPNPKTEGDFGPYYELAGGPPTDPGPPKDPFFDWNPIKLEEPPSPKHPKQEALKEFGANEYQPPSEQMLSGDPDFYRQINLEEPPPPKRPKQESPKEFGQTIEDPVGQVQVPSSPSESSPAARSLDPEE